MSRGSVFKEKRVRKDGGTTVGDRMPSGTMRGPQTHDGRSNLRGPQGVKRPTK